MPKEVEKFVKDRLNDSDFYPEKSEEEREQIAWGIGTKQYKKKHHQKLKSKTKSRKSDVINDLIKLAMSYDQMGLYQQADECDLQIANLIKNK